MYVSYAWIVCRLGLLRLPRQRFFLPSFFPPFPVWCPNWNLCTKGSRLSAEWGAQLMALLNPSIVRNPDVIGAPPKVVVMMPRGTAPSNGSVIAAFNLDRFGTWREENWRQNTSQKIKNFCTHNLQHAFFMWRIYGAMVKKPLYMFLYFCSTNIFFHLKVMAFNNSCQYHRYQYL